MQRHTSAISEVRRLRQEDDEFEHEHLCWEDALLPWPFRNKVWGEDGLRGRHGNVGPADFSHGLEDLGKPPLVTLIHFLL